MSNLHSFLTLFLLAAAPLSLWAHIDPGTRPGNNSHSHQAVLTGTGNYQYQTVPGWGELPDGRNVGPTHGGVVVDPPSGRVYVSTDAEHSILVYEADGTFVKSIAPQCRGFHAMDIAVEDGKTVIYGAQLKDTLRVCKIDVEGKILMEISEATHPDLEGGWKGVTGAAVAPAGSICCSMGYGSNLIHKFKSDGSHLLTFGGKGEPQDGQVLTQTSHGLKVDTRFSPARLIVVDRENRRLFHTDLDGKWVGEIVTGLRRPCAVSLHGGVGAIAELEGRVTLIDQEGRILTHLGDNPDKSQWANFKAELEAIPEGLFTAPHGLSFDGHGNLYVQDWNQSGRLTKLIPLQP